jgi:hypothetical protein
MKTIFTALAFIIFAVTTNAQNANGFNYSAVARNNLGNLITDSSIGIKISILKSSGTGNIIYSEEHNVNTDSFGVFNLIIGSGTITTGTFNNIKWWDDKYFIKIEMDTDGGSNYKVMGTSLLLSVPYAKHAETATRLEGNEYSHNVVDFWPRIAKPSQKLNVSFSGGSDITFTQSSTTINCPSLTPKVKLVKQQSSSVVLQPIVDIFYINPKRVETIFSIPSNAPLGVYDVILSPDTQCEHIIPSGFKINTY